MSQLSSRLQESEREAMGKVSDLEKKLIQTTKEVELLKVKFAVLLVKTDLGSPAKLWPAGFKPGRSSVCGFGVFSLVCDSHVKEKLFCSVHT